MGRRNPLTYWAQFFLAKDNHDIITHAKFGDDRLRGSGVVTGQISAFPIDFAGRPYNTYPTVWACDINKCYYCVWRCCLFPQGLQSIIGLHHAIHVSVSLTSRCSVENGWMNWASFWHGSFLSVPILCSKEISDILKKNGSSFWTLSQIRVIENFASACWSSKRGIYYGSLSVCSRLLRCPSVTGQYSRPT